MRVDSALTRTLRQSPVSHELPPLTVSAPFLPLRTMETIGCKAEARLLTGTLSQLPPTYAPSYLSWSLAALSLIRT